MHKLFHIFVLFVLCMVIVFSTNIHYEANVSTYVRTPVKEKFVTTYPSVLYRLDTVEKIQEKPKEKETNIHNEDVALIALITMAEAEGECEEGKRLVIDTILNRLDSDRFPNTVYEVIYQPNQFSSVWNGRIDRCEVRDDICRLVEEEIRSRTNHEVMFFTAGYYSDYGRPLFQVENHYFSSCN